ncbi:flagellar filament capping protein FliD [Desulfogranum marinum]|uniref:flagellar filament capping protein FliD n=1 Tax=Desulfogranum marinum TaxID=453220 RepID=UPI001966A2C1|nr:flagellar filament capping protein FliD [Desulfogranum marinum]MBM9513151.1 flagellar filament capping protein FliD [Desulfogranum marinum]
MAIQFSGLASGMDTGSIIDQLMNLERIPITRLEGDKTWMNNRLSAFTELDTKLKSFLDSIDTLGDEDTLQQRSVKLSEEEHLSASVSSEALAGTSYAVEVVSLAQAQKSVTAGGFAAKDSNTFGTGTLNVTVDGTSHAIEITSENNSLEGIMQAINDADIGISTGIINVGGESTTPYRLLLSGDSVGKSFSVDATGLTGGTDDLGAVEDETGTVNPPVTKAAQAHIRVDTIDIYSDSNTVKEAIPGVTLDLLKAETDTTTQLSVDLDKSAIKENIESFAKGYNQVISFITGQSVINGEGGGLLSGDSGVNSIKRHLQSMLTSLFENSGTLTTLSQLGFETQQDGTLVVNDETLSQAVEENLGSVVSLLSGEGEKKGLAEQFSDYLESMTSSTTGMLSGRKQSINSNVKRIDSRIEIMEMRLEQRQKTLEAQFSAMETLVSGMNAQSSFLTQQMANISSITNRSNN